MTTLMPGIDIDTLFIGREDQEGDMAAALQRRMMMTPTWKRGVGARFLGGRPPPTLGRAFREEEDDNEDDGDTQGR